MFTYDDVIETVFSHAPDTLHRAFKHSVSKVFRALGYAYVEKRVVGAKTKIRVWRRAAPLDLNAPEVKAILG